MPTLAQQALMQRLNLAAHGVACSVTRPNDVPVAMTGIWHTPLADAQPFGTDLRRRDPRRILELPRDPLDDVPRGSLITAADRDGGTPRSWRVDGIERPDDPLRMYLVVVPA